MKNLSIFLCSALLLISCSGVTGQETGKGSDRYPLEAFAVRIGDSYYHARIDQESHVATIGHITDTRFITGVEYTLGDPEGTISPNPELLIGCWEQEQTFTVTCFGETSQYVLEFPKFDESGKHYIFRDEFNVDGRPDETKWTLCRKGGSDWNDEMSESYDQVYVKDGVLVLNAEIVDGEYKASGIKTEGLFGFTFGRVECRARLPKTPNGAFPAIWMMPQKYEYKGWPNCGEIDIMEHIRQENAIHQTIHTHYPYDLGHKSGTTKQTVCDYKDWNIYAVEWTPEDLTFYVNDQMTFRYSNMHLSDEAEMKQWPFTSKSEFYLILNMGLGDPGTWAGAVDDANMPAVMEVDWIRVSTIESGE